MAEGFGEALAEPGGEGFGGEDFGGEGGDAGAPAEGGGGDAVDDAKMMLAEGGSPMNEVTNVVDSDGVILDHG
jgi:hypothetical protein